jgi:ABC-type glutathione transport system ATPase component
MSARKLLEVEHLGVDFATEDGVVHAVDDVSFELGPAEILAIVGESGSGKSVTALTVMGLSRGANTATRGSVRLGGTDLLTLPDEQMRDVRAKRIAMIFQDPMTALNPVYRVGDQIVEQIRAHEDVPKDEARRRAVDALRSVGIPNPERRASRPPRST